MKYLFFILILCFLSFQAKAADLVVTQQEWDAYNAYLQFKDVKAKKLIAEVLKQNSKSAPAYFVLGLITKSSEGNSTRALYYYKKALTYVEATCGKAPITRECIRWHSYSLQEKIDTLIDLDRIKEAYDEVLYYNKIYDPDLYRSWVWALIKMKKFDEAEKISNYILSLSKPELRITGLNNLCVIAAERNQRQKSSQICEDAANETGSMVLHYNAALAKFSIFDLPAAERLMRKATTLLSDVHASPWEGLVTQYTLENRYAEALSAAKMASSDHRKFDGMQEEKSRARFLMTISNLLVALGRMDDAYRLSREAFENPDRTGMVSSYKDLNYLTTIVNYHLTLQIYDEYLNEKAPQLSFSENLKNMSLQAELAFQRFLIRREAGKIIQQKDFLVKLVTPYSTSLGPYETIPIWLNGLVMDIVGISVYKKAVFQSMKVETEFQSKIAPYYAAFLAQVAFKEGDTKRMKALAHIALKGPSPEDIQVLGGEEQNYFKTATTLPVEERLMKDILKTLLLSVEIKKDNFSKVKEMTSDLFSSNPVFLRIYDIKLPVRIETDSGPYSDSLKSYLEKNPRFEENKKGVKLRIQSTKEGALVCLVDDFNSDITCTQTTRDPKKDKETFEKETASKFITQTFAPKIDLSQFDVNTLNGSPLKGSSSEKVDEILKETK